MNNLQRTIVLPIKIGEVEKKFEVSFPTVRQYIKVGSRKAELTTAVRESQYLNLIKQGTVSSITVLDLVDMVAWFETCIPSLMDGKEVVAGLSSIEDLDIFDSMPLLDVYINKFRPWIEKWEEIFKGVYKKEDKKEE